MKKIYSLAIASVLVALSGCGPSQSELEQARNRTAKLEAQVLARQAELDDIKFGSERLLAQAKVAYENRHYAEAVKISTALLARHPASRERSEASSLLADAKGRIEAANLQRKKEEENRANEERATHDRALGNMAQSTDEIKNITWISHKQAPVLQTYISTYFGSQNQRVGSYPLRLKMQYYSEDWLFVNSVVIKADDDVYEMGDLDFERDNSSGSIWEWVDIPIKDFKMLNRVMTAKRVVIRFNGRQYYKDFIVPDNQLAQIREVHHIWRAMGGIEK
jgi:hypothetical protein